MLYLMFAILILYALCRAYTALQMYCWTRWGFGDERRSEGHASPFVVKSGADGKEEEGRDGRIESPAVES